jgi:energy-coupling factor transporter ATP-binding protein EcfA2
MDFYRIKERIAKNGIVDVYPDFKVTRSKDLMIRAKSFYAIWDEERGLWSADEYDVQRLVDDDLERYANELKARGDVQAQVKFMSDFGSNSWLQFRNYVGHLSDSSTELDANLTFSNTEVKKEDYVSRRLPYALAPGDYSAWDELVGTLYDDEERAKIEWAIGSIVSGDSRRIQKFLVLYGEAGTGKSTILNIIQKLFEGYYTTFEAKALTSTSNAFSTEAFKSNPLVAIQHDGDLSKIEDNTKLNSIISHEDMTVNEKYKPSYTTRINAFLFMGTNKPVKITDAKSGIIRRLIDVRPTGKTLPPRRYQALMSQINFELGAIAQHCLDVYREMGKDYYSGYRPVEMMLQTDVFFNFIEEYYDLFREQGGVTLNQAHELYKQFCDDTLVDFKLPRYRFRDELKNYFGSFEERAELADGTRVRSWYSDFRADRFKVKTGEDKRVFSLVMDDEESIFDSIFANQPAQYAKADGTPQKYWTDSERLIQGVMQKPRPDQVVDTKLRDIDSTREHYVKVPPNHIVIDFDLKDADGNKSAERNLEAASQWPSTYAEFSKSGSGIHLHYTWAGEEPAEELARTYEDGIEIKVFTGDSSLRRRLSRCNRVPVAILKSGLPLKEKKVLNADTIKSEKGLRDLIMRNLRKEIHPGTKPSVDFIYKILEDAYASGMTYDVTDMRPKILAFANNSTHQALACIKMVQSMAFKSEDVIEEAKVMPKDERLVIFDVEVFKNLFIICWKYRGSKTVVRMINPTPQQVEELLSLKLVGFNNRRYDNHILYARYMGYSNEQLYELSQKLINNHGYFGEAYNVSYADIYEFASEKKSLKKWEIDLGLHHVENEWPWDQEVPPEKVNEIVEYCVNDVNGTEGVFEDRIQDFVARQILADLSGLSINATTQQHTAKIVFGDDRKPQDKFVYTDLSKMFPGYKYDMGKSTYCDEVTGEGGYVYAEPGMYEHVALLDVASMHPTSIEALNLFGEYTKNFSALKAARLAIKHKDFEAAKGMLGGKLARHLTDEQAAGALSYALKIVINIVYGLTAAKFDNSFRDPRNIDNIVAKRGALFMIDLKHFVQSKGFTVAHIKTDSIKIPNATPEIIQEVMAFGESYGYTFEHEATYEKFCLVNESTYIAKTGDGKWHATGAQFQHPYVFKTLFSREKVIFNDLCEAKTVQTAMYLDFEADTMPAVMASGEKRFVGKAGLFTPIKQGMGGGVLLREKDGKYYAVGGTKDYFWLESEVVKELGREDDIDMTYFEMLAFKAREAISQFGDFEWFAG